MKCPHCGAPIGERFQFCTTCGAALERREDGPAVPSAPSEPGPVPERTEKELEGIPLSLRKIWDEPVFDAPNPKPAHPESRPGPDKALPGPETRPVRPDPDSTRRFERPARETGPGRPGPSETTRNGGAVPPPARRERRASPGTGASEKTGRRPAGADRPSPALRILLALCALLLTAIIVILVIQIAGERRDPLTGNADSSVTNRTEADRPGQEGRDAILVDEDGAFLVN